MINTHTPLARLLILLALALSVSIAACSDDDDGQSDTDRDCRNDGLGCTEGFTCSLNEAMDFECLPDDPNNDPNNDMMPDMMPDMNPEAAIATCEATCADIAERCGADFAARCAATATEGLVTACNTGCESEDGRAQIGAAADLECGPAVPLAIEGFGLGDACFTFATDEPDAYTRVDRAGMPAVGTVVITSKDQYNASNPSDDVAGTFFPEIIAVIEAIHDILDNELTQAGLVTCTLENCLNQAGPLVIPDTLKITTDGPAGFPNGRLPADPVIDITLAVLLLDLTSPGQDPGILIGLNPPANDLPFNADFPFLAPPHE